MKKLLSALLICSLLAFPAAAAPAAGGNSASGGSPSAAVTGAPAVEAEAALLMEKETGTVLFAKNEHEKLEPASVTKIMTLLLIMEALDGGQLSLEDPITTSAQAAGKGGSQIYLKEGEQMTAGDMIKSIVVASANDASTAMAEHLAGSEEAFVAKMNARAAELGMADTHFANCTGLPAEGHVTSAYDIAVMSRALISHTAIRNYTTIWIDSVRNGAFQLANTNKLIRFYNGATGLKTGSTDSALYCLSATAERDGMELIAVILKAPSSTKRFESAKSMLNFGFANYALVNAYPDEVLPPIQVVLGEKSEIQPVLSGSPRILVPRNQAASLKKTVTLSGDVSAPVEAGQKLGQMTVTSGDTQIASIPIVAPESVAKLTWNKLLLRLMRSTFMAK